MSARRVWQIAFSLLMLLVIVQAVPYGRDHTNPPPGEAVIWDSPATQQLAQRACFDCHSNETKWPWYSSLAPISWRVQHDVEKGRAELNFSAWNARREAESDAMEDAGKTVLEREMPPRDYLLMHREARLTDIERAALARGLDRSLATLTIGSNPSPSADREGPEDSD